MSITALIVDDEQQSRDALRNLLKQFCPDVELVGAIGNIKDAITAIRSLKPDILFLDIHLGDKNGFDLLNMLYDYHCEVVFVTAHENFAIKAFEYAASNYLMKPVNYEQLIESVYRIRQKKERNSDNALKYIPYPLPGTSLPSAVIALSDMSKTDFVHLNEIIYLESKGAYTVFHVQNGGQHIKSKNLKFYESELAAYAYFIRVHKSFIVNKSCIRAYIKTTSELECSNGAVIPTSLGYKKLLELIACT